MGFSQNNLVYNGSFEDNSGCPPTLDYLNFCDGWFKANLATTDYVHSCSPVSGGANAPHYFMGYQQPFHGNAYCGLGFYAMSSTLVSEYLQTELIEPLRAYHSYSFTMYVNLADHSVYSISNFGALFSRDRSYRNDYNTLDNRPNVLTDFVTDTANWVKISAYYTASGGEKYLTIGRFDYQGAPNLMAVVPDTNIAAPLNDGWAYYLIDSVSLYDVTSQNNLPEFPNIFSPNGDGVNDFYLLPMFDFFANQKMLIFNRWGVEVSTLNSQNSVWYGKSKNGEPLSEGVYYYIYVAKDKEGKEFIRKGNIQLVR